ncbi:CDP-glycerol glycerophosphotransferase family protein [Fictibacillus barbaricus]|uniref:CDP-glycerol glycerophosphotransferase n=1 Tax=Fictibacillus barbaricus TaxID=182136 RepID=A0ABU1U1Y0_9BACL|nr:CDP-glycerol glycerophosphotransferase family protein [Fictibacillus barbaricus]MDR7073366.1 CDP-glycerol glycerophosphotransferase [Fictibacillus barbaricus]
MKLDIEIIKKYTYLLLIYLFNMFPIKKNKIFLFSYYGSQFGGSPKYITEFILGNYPSDKYDLVWAFNKPESKQNIIGVRKVRTMSLKYFYEICTSKIIITNFRTTDLFVKRKNQYYIQTWHSSLRLKQIEKDAEDALPPYYVKMAKKDSLKCDLLLSGSRFSTEIFKRSFWYDGEIFEHGIPRNDLLFQKNEQKSVEIKKRLNIQQDSKILLYAPTFRKNNRLDVYDLDFSQIEQKLSNKFGGEWLVLVKLHPHLVSQSSQLTFGENVVDVTSYDDVQELLLISDVLISDYSSLIFDFSITQRPCFLYVPDLLEYTNNDRDLYFDLMELPFVSATSNHDLLEKIESFQYKSYEEDLRRFLSEVGSFEDGRASEYLMQHIQNICF